jgi:RNA recognition motif-containing protein
VAEATVITDRDTGRSKGFGFVEMATEEAAQAAITKFNGYTYETRPLTVNEARPREERPRGGGGDRRGGDRRGGGGGGRDWRY